MKIFIPNGSLSVVILEAVIGKESARRLSGGAERLILPLVAERPTSAEK